ncbi:hypothetical protein ACQKP0_20330 [Heyndrickxia sp. NPDC080065]|uniref:hypothetical protein n=1 Tax=Heyndrickxia sp. NPDC080065 TaxID=3390568 RepID=UPI003D02F61D
MKEHQENSKEFHPIILSFVLFLVALFVFFTGRSFPNISLWIHICLYFLIDIGFIVSLILGVKVKNTSVKIFSILLNTIFIIPLSVFLFLLLLANGISEP